MCRERPAHNDPVLSQGTWTWACQSYLIHGVRHIFYLHFCHLVIKFLHCSLVSMIKKTVLDFSTALYPNFICGCLPEFKANPSQTATAVPCLCMCILIVPKSTSSNHARANEASHAWARNRALTLVKQTGLWGSNMLRHGTDCQV